MRTLGEIVHDARRGKVPTADEMRYALCAMDALITFDRMAFMKLAQAEKEGKKPFLTYSGAWQWEEHFGRVARALAKSPKDWLGPDNDPVKSLSAEFCGPVQEALLDAAMALSEADALRSRLAAAEGLLRKTQERLLVLFDTSKVRMHDAVLAELALSVSQFDAFLSAAPAGALQPDQPTVSKP